MRYLMVLCMIGLSLSFLGLLEQIRRYGLAEHGQEIATFLESHHSADPFEGRVQEFVADQKVANLIRVVLQTSREEKQHLAGTVVATASGLKERALFDGAIWAVPSVILAIVFSRLSEARRGRRPLDA
jgi:hypothetical protein